MSDLFANTAAPAPPQKRPRFAVGDRVRPRPEWRDGQTPVIPTGEVKQTEPFGKGQVLRVGDDRRWNVSGCFEPDDGGQP